MEIEQPAVGPTRTGRTGAAIALVVFAVVTAWSLHRHSLWLDETQSWAIARSSRSLGGLWSNLRYEGHPPLWHVVLFALTRVTTDVRAMQVLTWCLATATAAVVLFRAPWRLPVRIALCASYYLAFEYSVLSRSYGLTVLGFVVALVARRGSALRVVALVVVCLTSVLGVVLAAAVVAADLVAPGRPPRRVVVGAAAVAVAALLAGLSVIPPADSRARDGFGEPIASSVTVRAGVAFEGVTRALLPVPGRPVGWNHTVWREVPLGVRGLVGLVLVAGVTVLLWRRRAALVCWLVGLGGLLLVFAFVYPPNNLRHAGHVALVLLGALWLDATDAPEPDPWPRPAAAVWAGLLAVSVLAGVLMVVHYWSDDFNRVRSTAAAIERSYPDARVLSVSDLAATPVGAYLDRPVESVGLGRPVWFVRYDPAGLRAKTAPVAELVARVRADVGCVRTPVVVISGPFRREVLTGLGARPLGRDAGILPAGFGCPR